MNEQNEFDSVRTMLRGIDDGPPLTVDVDDVIRHGRRRRRILAADRVAGLATVALVIVAVGALLVNHDNNSVVPVTPPASVKLSFCVGVSAAHKTGQQVTVTFLNGQTVIGTPSIEVPMTVSIEAPVGPYSVVVDGKTQMSGTASASESEYGAIGTGCATKGP